MYPNDCSGKIIYSSSSNPYLTSSTYIARNPYYTSMEDLRRLLKIDSIDTNGDTKARINSSFYTPRKIIFNDPVSVVFWQDGTKTIVRRTKGEKFNKYTAFTAALAKKIFGNNTRVNAIVKSGIDQKEKDAAKKAKMAKKNVRNPFLEDL